MKTIRMECRDKGKIGYCAATVTKTNLRAQGGIMEYFGMGIGVVMVYLILDQVVIFSCGVHRVLGLWTEVDVIR